MTTLVSAFIHLSTNQNRSLEEYLGYCKQILVLDIPKVIFLDLSIYKDLINYANKNTKLIKTSLACLYLYKQKLKNCQINTDNPTKDTFEYFCIQCNKTEWVREAILLNYFKTSQFIWLDVGIGHIVPRLNIKNFVENLKTKSYTNIRIPSIWGVQTEFEKVDIFKDVVWYFAGGIFGGSTKFLLIFADLVKEKCLELAKQNISLWEVNIWYLIWKQNSYLLDPYLCQFNQSILENY